MNKILCISTAGKDTADELRMHRLADQLDGNIDYYCSDRTASRITNAKKIWALLNSDQWDLVYQEGTGVAGGIPLIIAALIHQQHFVVSSGDPIGGYFRIVNGPLLGSLFELYERLLYRCCAGFIGWTPYLTGAALKMGARCGVTVEGGVDVDIFYPYPENQKSEVRRKYGIPLDHVVCGVVAGLKWVPAQACCYGYELVATLKQLERADVSMLIVGDGDGRPYLEDIIPENLRSRVIFTGHLPENQVADIINAMDIGFVSMTGELGKYRLTTKLPEYLACGVPVAMHPGAGFFDYAAPAGWTLPDFHPASPEFHQHCAAWLDQLSWNQIKQKSKHAQEIVKNNFDYKIITPKFKAFINWIIETQTFKS